MKNSITLLKSKISKASVNRKLYVFLVCLSVSAFYWLLNSLSYTYDTSLQVKVNYINHPKNKIILNEIPTSLETQIKGVGYYLLAFKLGLKTSEIVIDLSKLQINNKENQTFLDFNFYKKSIETQMGSHVTLTSMYPDRIEVYTDKMAEKLIKIEPVITLETNNQYQLSGQLKTVPEQIKIIGPKSILDTLQSLPTELVVIKNIEESKKVDAVLDLKFLKSKAISTKIKSFKVDVQVDKFTEYSIKVPIEIINQPIDIDVSVFPSIVEIKFMVSLGRLSSLKKDDFRVVIDCSDLNNQYKKLNVDLQKYPSFVKKISLKPAKVEYVLRKKNN